MRKLLFTLALLTVTTAHAEVKMIDDWAYIGGVDEMTDEDNSGAVTLSGQASLAVLCRGSEPNLMFSPGTYLGSDSRYTVTYRIDQDEAKTTSARISGSGTDLFLPAELMKELEPATRVVMRVSDFRNRQHTHTFSLVGFYDATGLLGCVE